MFIVSRNEFCYFDWRSTTDEVLYESYFCLTYDRKSFLYMRTDNCVKISLPSGGKEKGDADKQGQLRIFNSGKVNCMGVKNPKLLQEVFTTVSQIIRNNANFIIDTSPNRTKQSLEAYRKR